MAHKDSQVLQLTLTFQLLPKEMLLEKRDSHQFTLEKKNLGDRNTVSPRLGQGSTAIAIKWETCLFPFLFDSYRLLEIL